jgi:hypothetical protein
MAVPGCDILEKIGSGGMATVYMARQVSLDRIVAVKALAPELLGEKADVLSFQTEAQAAAKLNHPGIIQVYDARVDEGACYIIMEYIAGRTLGDIVRDQGPLSEKEAMRVAENVAKALAYAWNKESIIHCDIKPDNIMLDADATVKVADLGLARTIRAISGKGLTDEIAGTPAYISPEQARGESDIDCRSDIYSLGATLYFLATGKNMFDASTDTEMLRKQIRETAVHPVDINPKLSPPFCSLIEKMLSRDKLQRPRDWSAFLADLERVRKNRLPRAPIMLEGVSAIRKPQKGTGKRSREAEAVIRRAPKIAARKTPRRIQFKTDRAASGTASSLPTITLEKPKRSVAPLVVLGVLLAALATVVPVALHVTRQRDLQRAELLRQEQVRQDRLVRLGREYAAVQAQERANPEQYDRIAEIFEALVETGEGTEYADLARKSAQATRARKRRREIDLMAEIKSETAALTAEGRFEDALSFCRDYDGELAAETREARQALAAEVQSQMDLFAEKKREEARRNEQVWMTILDDTIFRLITRGVPSALARVESALHDTDLGVQKAVAENVRKLLGEASRVDQAILRWFDERKGQSVQVEIDGKPRAFAIKDVTDNRIVGEIMEGGRLVRSVRTVRYYVDDLSVSDRMARLEGDISPGATLAKGLMMLELGRVEEALGLFEELGAGLGSRLTRFVVQSGKGGLADAMAERDMVALMRSAGVVVGLFSREEWMKSLEGRSASEEEVARLVWSVGQFREKHKGAPFAQKAEPILAALEAMPVTPSVFSGPHVGQNDDSASLPESFGQNDDSASLGLLVTRKMLADNPGLISSGIRLQADDGGRIVRLEVISPAIKNIGAVAALTDLRELVFAGMPQESGQRSAALSDISPLSGLPLTTLDISLTAVTDLTPLRGMKLTELSLAHVPVGDVAALRGMPLKKLNLAGTAIDSVAALSGLPIDNLDVSGTRLADLAPVRGMPLTHLNIGRTHVDRIDPLRGMPLRVLTIDGIGMRDFDTLKGMELMYLSANDTGVRDLSALRGMPLAHLRLNGARARDLSPLEGLPLKSLELNDATARNFDALRGMPLEWLEIARTRFSDTKLLVGMPLQRLDVSETRVSDLSPIRGAPLVRLAFRDTRVSDLAFSMGMPLVEIDCRKTRVSDYSPLGHLRLHSIEIDDPDETAVRSALRRIPTLRFVNAKTWMP